MYVTIPRHHSTLLGCGIIRGTFVFPYSCTSHFGPSPNPQVCQQIQLIFNEGRSHFQFSFQVYVRKKIKNTVEGNMGGLFCSVVEKFKSLPAPWLPALCCLSSYWRCSGVYRTFVTGCNGAMSPSRQRKT